MRPPQKSIIFCFLVSIISFVFVSAEHVSGNNIEEVLNSMVTVYKAEKVNATEAVPLGSGVVVGKDIIVTNCHVTDDAKILMVGLSPKIYAESPEHFTNAKLIKQHNKRDLCLLYAPDLHLFERGVAISFGDSTEIKPGQEMYVVGSPLSLGGTIQKGNIGQLRKCLSDFEDCFYEPNKPKPSENVCGEPGSWLIQISGILLPGNSGGALTNLDGELLGIPTLKCNDLHVEGIAIAMPVKWVQELIESAKRKLTRVRKTHALARAKTGHIAEAIHTAKSMREFWRPIVLSRIAKIQAEKGDKRGASETFEIAIQFATEKSQSYSRRAMRLSNIAEDQFEARFRKEGRETLAYAMAHWRQIKKKDRKENVLKYINRRFSLSKIALSLARTKDFVNSKVMARKIEKTHSRVGVLARIAKLQAQAGMKAGAKEAFAEARSVVKGMKSNRIRDRTLRWIAMDMSRVKFFEDASSLTEEIVDAYTAVRTYLQIVRDQKKAKIKDGVRGTCDAARQRFKEIDKNKDLGRLKKRLSKVCS